MCDETGYRQQINTERVNRGLAPLAFNTALSDAARQHSADMLANNFVGHTGSDGSTMSDRASQAGYSASSLAENVAQSSNPVPLWMSSSGHRQNLLTPGYREVGVGSADTRHTAMLGTRTGVYPVFINEDAASTSTSTVTITLPLDEADPNGWEAWISNSPAFADGQWQALTATSGTITDPVLGSIAYIKPVRLAWTLPLGTGPREVYVKYRKAGQEYLSRDTIWVTAQPLTDTTTMPPLPPSMHYFQSPAFVGAATFDVPLTVAGGMLAPTLTLHSNSYVADETRDRQGGALGVGSSLAEYAILRQPNTTPATTTDDSFVLLWDGVRYPLVVAGAPVNGITPYVLERSASAGTTIESQLQRIEQRTGAPHGRDGGAYWMLTDTAGQTWRFGYDTSSAWRYVAAGSTTHLWRWNLDRVTDRLTNEQVWSYTVEPGTLNGVDFERGGYLAEIAWNGNTTLNQAPDRRLSFQYTSRAVLGNVDYHATTERFYLTKRLDRIDVEIGTQRVWSYRFSYTMPQDGSTDQLLLQRITRYDDSNTQVLSQIDLGYGPPVTTGEGYHLAQVSHNGTLRQRYTYGRVAINGTQRYRVVESQLETSEAGSAASGGASFAPLQDSSDQDHSYGDPVVDPGGDDFWGYKERTDQDEDGNSTTERYRTDPPYQGEPYKSFCETPTTGAGASAQRHGSAAPLAQPRAASGSICHKQIANYTAVTVANGATRLDTATGFEDIRLPDGTYQRIQTNATYTATGQPIYVDQFGVQSDDQDDRYTERFYDPSAPDLVTKERTRDAAGQVVAQTTYRYAPNTQLLLEEGHWLLEAGRVLTTTYTYDPRGLRTAMTDPLGHTTRYGYDASGNQTVITDTLGFATHHTYDPLDRRLTTTDALSRTQELSYTARGELDISTDALGRNTHYTYDADGRLTTIDYPTGTLDVTYAYDAASNVITMTDGLGMTTYRYDDLHRMQERTRDGRTVTYGYVSPTEVSTIGYWGRGTVQYGFNAAGESTSVTPWGAAATEYTYYRPGQLATISRPNGVTTTATYDDAHQVTGLNHQRWGSTPATLHQLQYAYDSVGNRTGIAEQFGTATITTTFTYDPLNRLTHAVYPAVPGGPTATTVPYTLGPTGNRLSNGTTSLTYDVADQVNNVGYQYDANGNLLTDGTTIYAYDAANRLIQTITGGVTTSYAYDGWGNLIRETVNGLVTDYVIDEQAALPRILGEIRSDGTEVVYAYGPEGVTAQRSMTNGTAQSILYPLLDAQASVRELTDTMGTIVRAIHYDAWGAIRHSTGSAWTRLGYTGEPMGTHDGTVYLRARHYQPSLGRFLQRDSFPGIPTRPQSLNRYTYAENNPVTYTDPTGKLVFIPVLLAIWAVAEVALTIYDAYETVKTVADPCVGGWEKGITVTLFVGGMLLPGGGYGTAGKTGYRALNHLDHVDEAIDVVVHADEAVDTFRTLENIDDAADLGKVGKQADDAPKIEVIGNACSFTPDTLVATANGARPIGHLRVGDLVLAYDEVTGTTGSYTITAVWSHLDQVIEHVIIDDEQITTTPEHPFYTEEKGWVPVSQLWVGAHVRTADQQARNCLNTVIPAPSDAS